MTSKDEHQHAEIARKILDTGRLQDSLKKAARQAVLEHARAGDPIVVWRDQKIVTEDANAANHE